MANFQLRVTALVACLLSSAVAHAMPVIYDFVGDGYVCTYVSDVSCVTSYTGTFTGTVSIDVVASGPSGADSMSDGFLAWDENGWVESDFLISWGSNTFTPGPVPFQYSARQYAAVANDPPSGNDELTNSEGYFGIDLFTNTPTQHVSYAHLSRFSDDLSWLSDLSFPVVGLAPSGSSRLSFAESSTGNTNAGFFGDMSVTSFVARTTSVPEPGTLALFGLGLAGLGFARRRRATN